MGSIKEFLDKKNQPEEKEEGVSIWGDKTLSSWMGGEPDPTTRDVSAEMTAELNALCIPKTGRTSSECPNLSNAPAPETYSEINEAVLQRAIQHIEEIDAQEGKWAKYIDVLMNDSLLSKVRPINEDDVRALVHSLETFQSLVDMFTADGSIQDWGCMPQIGADVITAFLSCSGLSVVAGVQPINEECGTILYVNHENVPDGYHPFIRRLVTKPVASKVLLLKSVFGTLKQYSIRHRFGTVWEDEAAKDLVTALMQYLFTEIGKQMLEAADRSGKVCWSITPPPGISWFEHKQSFKDALAMCEENIYRRTGKGATFILAGRKALQVCAVLPGYEKLCHEFNFHGNIVGLLDKHLAVVAAGPQFPENRAIVGYRNPKIHFESPVVVAPYMLLSVAIEHRPDLVAGNYPEWMHNQRVAASYTAIDVVEPNLLSGLTIVGDDGWK